MRLFRALIRFNEGTAILPVKSIVDPTTLRPFDTFVLVNPFTKRTVKIERDSYTNLGKKAVCYKEIN